MHYEPSPGRGCCGGPYWNGAAPPAVSDVADAVARLAAGVGTGGTIIAIALQPALLVLVVVTVGLPLLLIATLALIAVYSRKSHRRRTAENIIDRLLVALRPR